MPKPTVFPYGRVLALLRGHQQAALTGWSVKKYANNTLSWWAADGRCSFPGTRDWSNLIDAALSGTVYLYVEGNIITGYRWEMRTVTYSMDVGHECCPLQAMEAAERSYYSQHERTWQETLKRRQEETGEILYP